MSLLNVTCRPVPQVLSTLAGSLSRLTASTTSMGRSCRENPVHPPAGVVVWSKGYTSSKQRLGSQLLQLLQLLGHGAHASSGKGKGSKGHNHMNKFWNCGKTGHYARNCSEWWWLRGKGKGSSETGAQSYEHADGWTWSDEHVDGLWKT